MIINNLAYRKRIMEWFASHVSIQFKIVLKHRKTTVVIIVQLLERNNWMNLSAVKILSLFKTCIRKKKLFKPIEV